MEESLNLGNNNLNLAGELRKRFEIKEVDIRTYSPLTLAFIGDSVYELIIRSIVTEKCNKPANILNKEKVHYVNAASQAHIADSIADKLTDEEADIYRRGRNAQSHTSAKNQSVIDYRKATGLEALCGYLYLKGEMPRILDLIELGINSLDNKDR
ncbi:Mini-ribonuclease 3 [Butyrivibrio sp. NC3005]|uniref:Mini-ribonuclease 3 n=1 Tax=Butyrivibrio sp. NC3005 TaxID=1280685 RepID=UPI0003FB3059|nr:ribonuclease III domain-containing protein [Butyrivibrio sp. NC3005]